jgi:hypothetical protein
MAIVRGRESKPRSKEIRAAVADRDVRYWHLADMLNAPTNVRFWGQTGH